MSLFRTTFNFVSAGGGFGSWSEVLYINAADLDTADLNAWLTTPTRLPLLNSANLLTTIRTADLSNPRVTKLRLMNAGGMATASGPAPIDSAIVVNLTASGSGGRRKLWMRGWSVGDAVRSPSGTKDIFSAPFQAALTAWLNFLEGEFFVILTRIPTSTFGYGWYPVQRIGPSGTNGQSRLVVSGQLGATPTTQITIGGTDLKDVPGLRGIYDVQETGILAAPDPLVGNSYIDLKYVTPESQTIALHKGRTRFLGYNFDSKIQASGSGPQYIGGRKSHSPFSHSRGARSANRGIRTSP
jgi:hypothetical protein